MPLWGNSDAVEDKPKHFTDAEKLNVYATEQGWVKKTTGTGGRAGRTQEEIIVAIGGLSASLNLADITAIDFNSTTADKSDGFTLSATVTFNEEVEVATDGGTPTLTVVNDTNSNHSLSYASGSGTNRLTFELAIAAGNAATELLAFVDIPEGKKATHVDIYDNSHNLAIEVFEMNINASGLTSKGSGNANTQLNITDVNATATNYLAIVVTTTATSNRDWGGLVTIADQ